MKAKPLPPKIVPERLPLAPPPNRPLLSIHWRALVITILSEGTRTQLIPELQQDMKGILMQEAPEGLVILTK